MSVMHLCICYWLDGFIRSLQAYIREQIMQTIAVIHKRSTLDSDKSRQRSDDRLFTDIARLIHTGGQSSVSNAINFVPYQSFQM